MKRWLHSPQARALGLAILLLALLAGSAWGLQQGRSPGESFLPELEIHFIDVGQGDATLIVGPEFTILVDAGRHDRNDVVPYLRSVGVEKIDLLVGTHPHSDHIGQFPQVLAAFPVVDVWLSGDVHTSPDLREDARCHPGLGGGIPRSRGPGKCTRWGNHESK